MTLTLYIVAAILGLAFGIGWFFHKNLRGKPAPVSLRPGDALPRFPAEAEDGQSVDSDSLRGKPAVLLFIRGNWCPFCNRQVEDLSKHYREINELGARLIFVTPKPLGTTRRVADVFNVEFEFWLDPELRAARQLGLLHEAGVPGKHRGDYGRDTVWPTAIVVDGDGKVRHVSQSKHITDRPDPAGLVAELKKAA